MAVFCGCLQPAATCSGGKLFKPLSRGLARSQFLCFAVAGSTRFPTEWVVCSFSGNVPYFRTSRRPSSFFLALEPYGYLSTQLDQWLTVGVPALAVLILKALFD